MFLEFEPRFSETVWTDEQTYLTQIQVWDQYTAPIVVKFNRLAMHLTRAESIRLARALLDANKALPPQTKDTK